jgi:hypothetical protein
MGIPLARTKGGTFQGVVNEVTFLPALGHDLRAPLTALKGRLQLLQRRLGRHSDRAEDLHDVENMLFHVARMSHQLDIVRDASQLRWGTFDLVCAPADLSTIVERALTYLRAPGSRTNLEIVIKERPLIGTLDAERLSHAVVALVSNAVRFSGENAPVRRARARAALSRCATKASVFRPMKESSSSPWASGRPMPSDRVGPDWGCMWRAKSPSVIAARCAYRRGQKAAACSSWHSHSMPRWISIPSGDHSALFHKGGAREAWPPPSSYAGCLARSTCSASRTSAAVEGRCAASG